MPNLAEVLQISGNLSDMTQEIASLTNQIVYFDGTFLENKSGVGRDSRNLLAAATLAYGSSVKVIYPELRLVTRVVRNSPIPTKSKFQKILKVRSIMSRRPEICHLEDQSIFIQSHLHCVIPAPEFQGKYIIRLHDVFPISNPEWFRGYSRKIFSVAFFHTVSRAIFICDSRTTQSELLKIVYPDKVLSAVALCPIVIPIEKFCGDCTGCQTSKFSEKHVISISTLEPRKNFSELITAWINSDVFNLSNTYLYIVGRQGWKSSKLAKKLKRYGPSWGIRWIKDACDASVQELLRNSEFLVSTSIEEGFNLSVAEALLQEVPVLISNNQVHTELYFSVANFYNLNNPIELSKKIKDMHAVKATSGRSSSDELYFGNYESALKNLANALKS